MQMAGILFSNLGYYFNLNVHLNYTLDYIIGNSLLATILFYICSYTFEFCKWHRLIITANFINVSIAAFDKIIGIPISSLKLLVLYHIVAAIFILMALYNKFVYRNEKCNKHTR